LIEDGGVAHAQRGDFGGGGFHGGSIGNAGNVGNRPYLPGGYSGYGYDVGPVGFEGEGEPARGGSSLSVHHGSATEPPAEPQDGRGVYVPRGEGTVEGPSWDTDWWSQDPRAAAEPAADLPTDPAVGTTVASLPRGHDTLYSAHDRYYFHDGTYYQPAEAGFRVVAPPIGIEVEQLPSAAELVEVDNQQYLVCKGIYYQALFAGSGIVYRVVDDPSS
jgi:hypothetical protein